MRQTDTREMGSKATWPKWSLRNLIWKCLASHTQNPYKEKIPRYMSIEEDLLYKEIPSPTRNGGQLYITIKTPNPSQTKVRVIFPNSGTLEL